jgi:hypothetical protein
MAFLYPAFLIGAVAVALPIVLHLLRRDDAPEVPFTAVRLLRRAPVERSRRRRLRDLLLLAARVAALVLLAAAFARPYLQASGDTATLVVAIDRSFSMSAPGRFERALEGARTAIDGARSGERVALIAFDDRADVLSEAGSPAEALAALEGVRPGFGATRYEPVVRKAVELADGTAGRLAIVTDMQRSGWADQQAARLPPNWQLELLDPGGAPPNIALTGVRVEADRIVASVQNFSDTARQGTATVVQDGRELVRAPYAVGPASTTEVPIVFKLPATGGLTVNIDDPGGLAADDTRYAVLDSHRSSVLIVSGAARQSGFYLEKALATTAEEPDGLVPEMLPGSAVTAAHFKARSAVVLLSTRGLTRQVREALGTFTRDGGGLVLAAAPDLEPDVVSSIFSWNPAMSASVRAEAALSLSATDPRHPIVSPFGVLSANLGRVRFDRSWRVRPDGWSIIARFSDGTPALLERAEGRGRIVLLASDVDKRWNDFPLHPAFVPFTIETVRYAAVAREIPREFTMANAPAGLASRPGLYPIESPTSGSGRVIAVNADARESSLDRIGEDEFRSMVRTDAAAPGVPPASHLQARQTEASQSFWRYGLMLMLIALVAESVVGRVQ